MSVEVFEAASSDRAAWATFTASSPGREAGHAWEFHDLLHRLFGQRPVRLAARRGTTWLAVLPLVLQDSLLGRFLTSVPYLNYAGVLGTDAEARGALAERAVRLARELRADRLEVRGRDGSDLPIPSWEGKACYQIELPPVPDALWEALGSKVRAQVKRPSKEGFAARVVKDEGRSAFYPLLARRWHALGSPVLPESFFERMEALFGDELEYVLVERHGEAAAAGVLLRVGTRVEIPWAASAAEHDRYGVNMLLYWKSLEHAMARGAACFDFGRSTPASGNARFKLQWGATERALRWNVEVRAARGRTAERGDSRRRWVAYAWRHLPGFMADRLGPALAARIPY
jgi:serine/alanine adding enzyme